MRQLTNGMTPSTSNAQLLLAYVADLELEVDRLRKHSQFVQHEVRGSLKRIQALCADAVGVDKAAPALAEQVFRWQQRLEGALDVTLQFSLEHEYVEWFPARLRHILDNLLSNALKYRDPSKVEAWVHLGLRVSSEGFEFRVSDNGLGLPPGENQQMFELFYRAAPARAAGLGVGLAVVKLLVEQSGGTLTADSGEGQGTTFVVVLPRYDVDDYLL